MKDRKIKDYKVVESNNIKTLQYEVMEFVWHWYHTIGGVSTVTLTPYWSDYYYTQAMILYEEDNDE